jgi:hypothetical protein
MPLYPAIQGLQAGLTQMQEFPTSAPCHSSSLLRRRISKSSVGRSNTQAEFRMILGSQISPDLRNHRDTCSALRSEGSSPGSWHRSWHRSWVEARLRRREAYSRLAVCCSKCKPSLWHLSLPSALPLGDGDGATTRQIEGRSGRCRACKSANARPPPGTIGVTAAQQHRS